MLYICSATALGFPFLQPSLKVGNEMEYGVNFAVAGATALDTSFLTERSIFTQTDLSLDVQIGWFQDLKGTTSRTADPAGNDITKHRNNYIVITYIF